MKKLLVALCMTCVLALAAHAQDGEAKKSGDKPKKPELTAEQKTVYADLVTKYDLNKDGKLDKEERSKMSAEDKAKWDAAFPHKKKGEGKPAGEKPAADKPADEAKP